MLEVAVIGAPDPGRGMVVQAYVVLRDGAAADPAKAAELQDFTKARVAPQSYLRSSECFKKLKMTAEAKLALDELLKQHPKSDAAKTAKIRLAELAKDAKDAEKAATKGKKGTK